MAMGKRKARQEALFITADQLPRSGGHPFYKRLNALLAEFGFDHWIEARCEQYYEQDTACGRPSIPPGVYFRMLLVGYFERHRRPAWHRLAVRGQLEPARVLGRAVGRENA